MDTDVPTCIMRGELSNPVLFKRLCDILKSFIDMIDIDITENEWIVHTFDSARVFVIDLVLDVRSAFRPDSYHCPDPRRISVRLDTLCRVTSTFRAKDRVQFSLNSDEDALLCTVRRDDMLAKTSEYKVAQMLFIDKTDFQMPDIEYRGSICLPPAAFRRICDELGGCGDTLLLRMDAERLSIEGRCEQLEARVSVEPPVKSQQWAIVFDDPDRPLEQQFRSQYFAQMSSTAALKEAGAVLMQLREDQPMCMEIQIEGAGTMTYYLAPLIPEES